MATEAPTFCARHPKVETYLRCGRCNTPICPRCLVQTPVGSRCPDCARMRRLPMYDVGPAFLARAAAAGLAVSLLVGLVGLFLLGSVRFGLFGMLIFGGLFGYAASAAVSRATNRKRGRALIWTTVVAMALGLGLARAALAFLQLSERGAPESLALPRALAVGFSPDLGILLLLAVAAVVVYNRLR
jgi:hypothetical protein